MKTPVRFEGGTRPWNVPDTPLAPQTGTETEKQRREREICFSCPLPDCDPRDIKCPRRPGKSRRGPPRLDPPDDFLMWAHGPMTDREWAEQCDVSLSTIKRWRRQYKIKRR